MKAVDQNKNNVLDKLRKFLKKKYLRDILIGTLKALTFIIFTFLFFSIIESFGYFNSTTRMVLFFLLILLFVLAFIILVLKPLLNYIKSPSLKLLNDAAGEIGNNYQAIKDNLLNSLQLLQTKDKNTSNELIEAAFSKVYKNIAHLNFNELINYTNLRKYLRFFGAVLFSSLIVIISFGSIGNAAFRLLNFNKEFKKPFDFSLHITPGNAEVKKGSNVKINVFAKGKVPDEIIISTKKQSETEYKEHRIKRDSNNNYNLSIKNVKSSFTYFAYKNDVKTKPYQIEVTTSPMINKFTLDLIPPNYSNLPTVKQENNGNISALKGTRIKLKLTSTKILSSANINYNDNSVDTLLVKGNNAAGEFIIQKEKTYYFEITDTNNNLNENPIKYSISVIPDNYPEIKINSPEQNSLLPYNDIVSINYTIKDDYGFSKMLMHYRITELNKNQEQTEYETIELNFEKSKLEQTQFYNWDASRLNLKENEIVTFYLEVFDNDKISGPKSTKSEFYRFRVPSLEEFFTQSDYVQESAIQELTETMKDAEELQKELRQMGDELKQNEQKIDWNEKERIEQAVNKFEEIKNKISDVQQKLENMRQEMTENNLLSEETIKKYNELQDLMDELSSDEMKKALEQMQNALEKLMRDNVQKSLENFTMNEKMFQKSIERTLNLLKKIQIEQKMDEVIKRTEKLIDDLEKLSSETEKSKNDQSELSQSELTEEQKSIDKQLKNLQEEMKKLSEKMNDVDDTPKEQMDELNRKFDKQNNMELSKETLEQLEQQNFEQSLQNQQQLSHNMNSMKNELQQLQQQMQQQSQQMVMQNMLKAIDDIIGLSKEQEKLKSSTDNSLSQPSRLPQMLQEQMEIKQNLEKILKQVGELAQKTFAVSPEMGKALGNARREMNKAISGLQGKNGQRSSFSQGEAMKNLNDAAMLMQNSLQSMMQGGGEGGGMMSLMQQLQQMAQQQMGLNNMTKMMQQGKLTMQQQAQLQRLAQEQGMIQKSLAELNKEARQSGESKKLASNLEKVLEDMKEVISGLNTEKIDDDLIRKQERILSKLLDAQRSINERDFEDKRESRVGKEFNLVSPENLILTNEKAKDILREELIKAVQEGYTKDYEELIRRYFESLNEPVN